MCLLGKIQIIKSNVRKTDLNSNEIIIFLAVCLNTGFVILSSNASKYSFTFIDCWKQLPLTATKKKYPGSQKFSDSAKRRNYKEMSFISLLQRHPVHYTFRILNVPIGYVIRIIIFS